MIEKFPLSVGNRELLVDDYFVFSTSFSEILLRYIPTVQQIDFFAKENDFLEFREEFSTYPEFLEHFHALKEGRKSHAIVKGVLLLAFPTGEREVVLAVLTGADPLLLQKMSTTWLDERIELIEREFHLLKQARVDVQTGLLNLANLYSLLESGSSENNLLLTLVELPPVSTSLRYSMKYTHQCVVLLKTFIRGRSILHYLGHNTFALVLRQGEEKKASTFESSLVAYLKKAGCPRVHVGSSTSQLGSECRIGVGSGLTLLDEAWTSLHKACTRGPFSFCEYKHIAFPLEQPLAPPESTVVRKISRWTRDLTSFALILFRGDNNLSVATELVQPFVTGLKTIPVGKDLYVLYPGNLGSDVKHWVQNILTEVSDEDRSLHISAGIACYPFSDIRKSETPFCCKKALLHAAFFGSSSCAIFDHLTLNISGDVYFGEGDFTLAIKEYKRGLKCCAGDVNLYNSLGVTLAMMNRTRQADECFKSGLALEPNNFMALYNMGLSKQSQNKKNEAVDFLARAYEVRSAEDVDPHLISDLKLQLGILSCETGLFESSIKYIESWLSSEGDSIGAGKVYYYLGLSHYQLGDIRSAIKLLERALGFDGFDDRAMNLLGRSYLQEKEGEEVALSLCKKSVELDPGNPQYKLYLAEIYVAIGDCKQARELLRQCLKRKALKPYAQLLMGEGYLQESQIKRAEGWFRKVQQQSEVEPHVAQRAKVGLKSCISLLRKVK